VRGTEEQENEKHERQVAEWPLHVMAPAIQSCKPWGLGSGLPNDMQISCGGLPKPPPSSASRDIRRRLRR
jgi:hypothetical protein